MKTEYTIDDLTSTKVSVKSQKYYENQPLGKPYRKSYVNSVEGRIDLRKDLPNQQINSIFAVWGEKPTID